MKAKNPSAAIAHEHGIVREHILRKYWELANLGPEQTKGNIAGQLKALDSLCEELDQKTVAKPKDASRLRLPEIYQPEWLKNAARDPTREPTGD